MTLRPNRAALAATAVAAALALGGCGDGPVAARSEAAPLDGAAAAGYDAVVGAVTAAGVPICPGPGGDRFLALPAPGAEVAREHSWFRYLEGRIYELGPCPLPSGGRNELRIYRYADAPSRDTALRDVGQRMTRPTSTFAFRDVYAVELWSPEPGLDSPIGQVAAQAHSAIGRFPLARHLDVDQP